MRPSPQIYWTNTTRAKNALVNGFDKLRTSGVASFGGSDASLYTLSWGEGGTLAVRASRTSSDQPLFSNNGVEIKLSEGVGDVINMVPYGGDALLSTNFVHLRNPAPVLSAIYSAMGLEHKEDLITRLVKKGVPEDRLDIVAGLSSNEELHDVAVNTQTGTGCVIRYSSLDSKIGLATMYLKVGDSAGLIKEYVHLQHRRAHSLLRPITVTPHSLEVNNGQGIGCLITYGAQNKGLIDPIDLQKYLSVRNELFTGYASSRPSGLAELKKNKLAVPVFDASLAQLLLQEEKENPLYSLNPRPEIIPFEELVERAKKTSPAVLQEFRALEKPYVQAVEKLRDLPEGNKCVVDIDRRGENTYVVDNGFLIGHDFGHVQISSPAQQLASIGSLKSGEHARFALYCLENLPHVIANHGFSIAPSPIIDEFDTFSARAKLLAGIRNVRLASAKINCNVPNPVVSGYIQEAHSYFV